MDSEQSEEGIPVASAPDSDDKEEGQGQRRSRDHCLAETSLANLDPCCLAEAVMDGAGKSDCCLAEASFDLPGPECFVATATLGSAEHPDLNDLRAFRDRVLAKNFAGRLFIRWYYRYGAYLARFIRPRPLLKKAVRDLVVRPMARFARFAVSR